MNSNEKEMELLNLQDNNLKLIKNDGLHFYQRRRFHLFILMFIGSILIVLQRTNMSVAIISMTEPYNGTSTENGTVNQIRDFDWISVEKGYILSAYFYGYMSTQFVGGWLAAHFSPRVIYCLGIAIPSLINLLTPLLAKQGLIVLILTRLLDGIIAGTVLPSSFAIWARWAPYFERSFLVTFSLSGMEVGAVLIMSLGGFINQYLGWAWNFYFPGLVGLLWTPFWLMFVRDSPKQDPFISKTERNFIELNIGKIPNREKIKHPWGRIFTSAPVWATILIHINMITTAIMIQTQAPIFMRDILKYDMKKSGILASMPAITLIISHALASKVTDMLIKSQALSITKIRKIIVCLCNLFGGTVFVIIIYLKNPVGIIICLCLIKFFQAWYTVSILTNWLDIAAPHASILYGVGSTFGFASASLITVLIGYIVTDKLLSQWSTIFIIMAVAHILGAVIFFLFGSGKRQPWVYQEEEEQKSTNNIKNN